MKAMRVAITPVRLDLREGVYAKTAYFNLY